MKLLLLKAVTSKLYTILFHRSLNLLNYQMRSTTMRSDDRSEKQHAQFGYAISDTHIFVIFFGCHYFYCYYFIAKASLHSAK